MAKKLALNVFYNLVLILSIIGMGWAFKNDSLLIVAFFVGTFCAILYFKIQLVKSFKNRE
ncbi:DUF6358 family protein [Pedobacter insulae]|uniref:DUF6358 family protein n=1 Tax=Pedobacter insulae TaxID=414048 RepID=UPI000B8907FD|nr:DUF6358 family protein [Pedobacter insulae]